MLERFSLLNNNNRDEAQLVINYFCRAQNTDTTDLNSFFLNFDSVGYFTQFEKFITPNPARHTAKSVRKHSSIS